VRCGTVRKHCRRVADHRSALRCDVYVVDGLQSVTVPCGALQCVAVHCGNIAEGFWTIAVPYVRFSALLTRCRKLPDHFGSLWSLTVHCSTLPKCCGRLAVHCGTVQKHCGRVAHHHGALRTLWKAYGPLWCSGELLCIAYCTQNTEHTRPYHTSLRGARFTATVILDVNWALLLHTQH